MDKTLPFANSKSFSIGIELELQLIDPITFDLATKSKELINAIQESMSHYRPLIKPEITQSMIEINSSIHENAITAHQELRKIVKLVNKTVSAKNTLICGGGSHPFQFWGSRKIFPTKRFIQKSREHGFFSKQFTMFGMHVHLGCENENEALYLTHALIRYAPQLIALTASSPFYQGAATGFQSTRAPMIYGHPLSGVMPYLLTWQEFSNYFYLLQQLNIIETMKDIYWDVRPKPEFGTVEIRVFDMPLTLEKSIIMAAYVQTLAHYILLEKPIKIQKDLYYLYPHNRLQAAHRGLKGNFIDPLTMNSTMLVDDILKTLKLLDNHAQDLKNQVYLEKMHEWIQNDNDANLLTKVFSKNNSLEEMVKTQCDLWMGSL